MFPVKSRSALELWCNVFQIIGLLEKWRNVLFNTLQIKCNTLKYLNYHYELVKNGWYWLLQLLYNSVNLIPENKAIKGKITNKGKGVDIH